MPRRGPAGPWAAVAIGLAIVAAGSFLIALALRGGEVIDGIYRNADYASTPVIAELFGERGAGDVTLGNYPWLESLYVLRLTSWLPDHIGVWESLPFIGFAATILAFAWTLRATVSAGAALVGALALACPSPLVMGLIGAPANRLPTLAHAVLLTLFLATLPGLASRGSAARGAWGAALAISLAPGVASDPLLLIWGVVPMLLALAVGWRLGLVAREGAALGGAATVAGALGGWLLTAVAASRGLHTAEFPIHLSPPGDWPSNAWDVLRSIAQLFHGQFVHGGFDGPLAAAETAMAVLATAGAPLIAIVLLLRLRPSLADPGRPPDQRLLLVFWAASLIGVVAAVLLTDVAAGLGAVRYLLVCWPALIAIPALLWGNRAIPPLALIATACATIGIVQLDRGHYDNQGLAPSDSEIAALERFVERHHLDHGYAGYWDAAPITYLTDFEALTYPVGRCGPLGRDFCQFSLHTIDSWYRPVPGARTFFVYDTRDIPVNPGAPPPRWGRPLAVVADGDLRLFAYDYDLASVLAAGRRPPAGVRRTELEAG
jgi:hypothetical protein